MTPRTLIVNKNTSFEKDNLFFIAKKLAAYKHKFFGITWIS